jgi:thioesterase domain-containing protein
MTEASHQMASNPLPPLSRKAGTVGIPAGPKIAILNDIGQELSKGEVGEIAIKGLNVMKGYEDNDEANQLAFTNSWFRTGDEGYFDNDNYLVIKDRIKEIINRGGEKVSPREVDEVLLNHPSVKQAVTFAVPHPILGEDIGVAIVLEENDGTNEREIQEYISKKLAVYKIPRYIKFVKELPKGPTGKLQRIGLSKRLGISSSFLDQDPVNYRAPRTQMEILLEQIWSKNLEINNVGVKNNFFQLGGDSILAAQIIAELCERLHRENIPLVIFLYAPTIEKMAKILEEDDFDLPTASLVAIQSEGEKTPIYCVHACEGEILFLSPLSQELGQDRPFYGLRAQGLDGNSSSLQSIDEMAEFYLREIRAVNPSGPYIFAGAGVGGLVALEMTSKTISDLNIDSRANVEKLVLFDTVTSRIVYTPKYLIQRFLYLLLHLEIRVIFDGIINIFSILYRNIAQNFLTSARIYNEIVKAGKNYRIKKIPCDTLLIVSEDSVNPDFSIDKRIQPWKELITGSLDVSILPGKHLEFLKKQNVAMLSEIMKRYLG